MIYIIYKDPKDKDKYKDYFNRINNYLYNGDETILKKFYSRVAIVDYKSFANKELLEKINKDDDYISSSDKDLFYKIYDPIYKKMRDYEELDMVNLYTHAIACSKEALYLLTETGTDYTGFDLFYGEMNKNTVNGIKNITEEPDIYGDLTNLALIAFTNSKNILENNDLINGYLYDRKATKDKYENLMGRDSIVKLNYYFNSFVYTKAETGHLPEKEYIGFLDELKLFFFLRMTLNKELSFDDKNSILTEFEKTYSNLKNNINKKTV